MFDELIETGGWKQVVAGGLSEPKSLFDPYNALPESLRRMLRDGK